VDEEILIVKSLRFYVAMAHSSSRSQTTAALLDVEADVLAYATCPMCHTPSSVTQGAIDAGGDWRCVRCGQHWDGKRLATVAAYAAWTAQDRVRRRDSEDAAYRDSSPQRLGGRP
jgi:ribosomal protein L37AE/L43A